MDLRTQKIISREILFLFLSIFLSLFFWLGLISYNHYLEIHSNNLIVEIRHKDSLRNNISRYNLTIAHQKDIIFNQYGLIKGGVLDDTLPDVLPPFPKRLKILEPIGYTADIDHPIPAECDQ